MMPFEDPASPGNGPEYHTGKPCIEDGRGNPAGTAWSPHWCVTHNAERIKRISSQGAAIVDDMEKNPHELEAPDADNS